MNERAENGPVTADRDSELLRRIAAGDSRALAEFYDAHGRLLYSLALNVVSDPAGAEEVVQDVFVKLWENAGRYDPQRGSALGWVVTMTRRQAIDHTRGKEFKARSRATGLDNPEAANIGSGDDAKADTLYAKLRLGEALTALEGLNPAQREVIELSFYRGFSHSEIAEVLNAPLGTVKSRIREAVSNLRRILGVEPA